MNWPWNKRKQELAAIHERAADIDPPPVLCVPRWFVLAPTHVPVLVCPLERFVGPMLHRAGFDRAYYEPDTLLEQARVLRPDVVILVAHRGEEAQAEYLETVRKLRGVEGCAELPVVVFRSISPRDGRVEEAPGVVRITIPFSPTEVLHVLRRLVEPDWMLGLDASSASQPRK